MSGNDQMNWDDDLDFESLADEHDAESGMGDSGEGSSDLQDLSYDEDPAADKPAASGQADEAVAAPDSESSSKNAEQPVAKAKKKQRAYKRRSGVPAVIMGLLFGFSAIASGLGLGGAVLLVSGLDVNSLWIPSALTQIGPWMDLQNNPIHVLYLVGLGIVLLTLLIGWRIQSFSRNANRNLKETEELLGHVLSLRLGDDSAWQNPVFKKDPAVEGFVYELLGAWRLQVARQDKNLALEGELRRLEQAVSLDSRDDMGCGFDHPLVGQLADHMVRRYDEKRAAEEEIQAVRTKDQHESGSIIGVIQDARSWNRHSLDQLGVQAATVGRLARAMAEAEPSPDGADAKSSRMAQISVSLRELHEELASIAASAQEVSQPDASNFTGKFTDLIDRGGKLAFQIAMEVASLGQRGERLLPMAQALEELTTEFRESAGQISGATTPAWTPDPEQFQGMNRKIDGLIGLLDSQSADSDAGAKSTQQDLPLIAENVTADLEKIAGSFNHQAERLTELGTSFAALSGVAFDPGDLAVGKPDNPPDGSLQLSQMDPFTAEPEKTSGLDDIDPFATADSVLSLGEDTAQDSDFSSDVTPGLETDFSSAFGGEEIAQNWDDVPVADETVAEIPEEPKPLPIEAPLSDSMPDSMPDPFPTTDPAPAPTPIASAEPDLPQQEERVYDLSEFGAVAVDEDAAGAETVERIYDLAEFGAVGMD
jgi:hypothetical protein